MNIKHCLLLHKETGIHSLSLLSDRSLIIWLKSLIIKQLCKHCFLELQRLQKIKSTLLSCLFDLLVGLMKFSNYIFGISLPENKVILVPDVVYVVQTAN